jgi:hypothetical protein
MAKKSSIRGYNKIREFVHDYKTYLYARKVDPGRDGETISAYLKNRINQRLKLATSAFKTSTNKKGYTEDDLKLIASQEFIHRAYCLDDLMNQLEETGSYKMEHLTKIIKSKAFQSGKLPKFYKFIPIRISSKEDIRKFIRSTHRMNQNLLESVLKTVCKGNWRKWLNELETEKKITWVDNMVMA